MGKAVFKNTKHISKSNCTLFLEETIKVLNCSKWFLWCWTLHTSESRSKI